MASTCQPSNDDVFGPVVQACRSEFDFTLLFEQTILSIGPAALFLLSTLPRSARLLRATRKTFSSRLRLLKVVAAILLVGVQLGLLITWAPGPPTRATLPALILSFLSALAILFVSILEHSRAVRPSLLLNIYLLASLVFDGVQARTLYLRHENGAILGLFTTSIGVKALLLLLESKDKRSHLKAPYNSYPPEATSGIFNTSFFLWLNPILATGFRKLLTLDDLFRTDNELLSTPLRVKTHKYWPKYCGSGRHALTCAMFHCIRRPLALMVFPRLCLIGFNYAQPFLISSAIKFVSQPIEDQNKNDGYGLIAAAGLIYLGIAHQIYRAATAFRGCVVSLIYDKTIELQAGVYDESSALSLMSTDLDRLTLTIVAVGEIWARLIEMAIGLWLLARELGWVCVAPIVIVLGSIFFAGIVSSKIGPRQKDWMKGIQRRVGMTSSMLGSMKSVKMMGLSNVLFESLQNQRVWELGLSKKFRDLNLWRLLLSFVPQILAPLACFIIFSIQASVNGSGRLTAGQTFSSLAIISLLTGPASDFLQSLPQIGMGTGCMDRIQAFLLSESRQDDRIMQDSSTNMSAERTDDGIELKTMTSSSTPSTAIVVRDLQVRPSTDSPIVLHGLNFQVNRGALVMLVGTVGAGKSTLLKSLVGELKFEDGGITVTSKDMAYCSQSPWLPNATVREIVCGIHGVEDSEWYRTVLHACAFDQDILELPNNNDTLIGSRGVTLSGGQKQRLALARAVYARRSINVLDDVLSAIDAKTEYLVVERLFGKRGLFKRLGSTVVLATHAIRHLPLSDHIVVLGVGGKVAEQGTFDDLRLQDGFVNKIILKPELLQSKPDNVKQTESTSKVPSPLTARAPRGPTASDADDLNRRIGDIAVYKYYLRAIGWKIALVNGTGALIYMLSSTFPRLWLSWYADGTIASLLLFAVIYVVAALVSLAAIYIILSSLYNYVTPKSGAGLHQILLRSVLGAPQSFFDETDSGITLNRFSQDMTLIDGPLPNSAVLSFSSGLQCLAQIALISTGSTYMALTCPALLLAVYLLQKFYLRTSRQMRFLDLECRSPLYTHFAETLEGLSTIRAFGWQEQFVATNLKWLDESQRPYYLLFCIQRWLYLVLQLLITAIVMIVMALATSLTKTTSGGRLGVSLSSIVQFNSSIAMMLYFWTQMETSLGAISRLKRFEEGTVSENKPEETSVPSGNWPQSGVIEFKNISASYGSNVPALRDISFHINAGEKIGICGRTGSGKSSLLSVLLRIIDIDSGSLVIDGQDLQLIPRELIRSRMVTIPQDPFILSGSVRLNADPYGATTDQHIITALQKVGLWDLLESRGGLDADMNLNPLSQGQQQIFCLARAMLRTEKGRILVLDEATSSIDADTDLLIQKLIREEFNNFTVLTVAHRLDTIMDSDRVVVLDGGRVVELGSPEELMKSEGAFWELRGGKRTKAL